MVTDELRAASDAEIDDAVRFADPMLLRGLLFQLTGDAEVAATPVTEQVSIDAAKMVDEAAIALVRARAAAYLKALRDGTAPEPGPDSRLLESLELAAGAGIPAEDAQVWLEELATEPFARGFVPPVTPGVKVVVIGAGMGGLNAAIQLQHAGIDFEVLEKNSGVGGTWFENRYPGARVDSPSRAYLHILGVDYYPTHPFCERELNEKYFNWMTDTYGVRDQISFDTEVVSLTWDEAAAVWEIVAKSPEGQRVLRSEIVISAVGLLSRPLVPSIPGAGDFGGQAFHSSWWPEGLDVSDKTVAVIGTGCSGVQLVPELAELAQHTVVFQRTPQWLFDNPGYTSAYPPQINWLDRNLPLFSNFMRFRSNWLLGPYISEPKRLVDPDFHDPHARSAVNKRLRDERMAFIHSKFTDHPELIDAVTPPHPPFSARPVQVDRDRCYYDAILRDDVTLVTEGVASITPTGLKTVSGEEVQADVIVYATGFRANECLWPMEVLGRDGRPVQDLWAKDGPRAYLGTMLPGFPNLFMIYGPNMNPYGGLGVVNLEEMVMRWILQTLGRMAETRARTVEPTEAAYWRWNDALDAREEGKIYRDPRARSYYQNEHGRSATNCAFTGCEMWHFLREPDWGEVVVS